MLTVRYIPYFTTGETVNEREREESGHYKKVCVCVSVCQVSVGAAVLYSSQIKEGGGGGRLFPKHGSVSFCLKVSCSIMFKYK